MQDNHESVRLAPADGSAMTLRYLPLLIAVLLACTGRARAARVLDHYDVDSLSAMAKLIVKAEVGKATDVQTRDGNCAVWDVKVLSVLNGDAQAESTIRVAGIEEYNKGPGIEGVDKGFPRLTKGDVVYLFLLPKGARGGYAKYALTNADWKVIESGTRLITKDGVHSFGQYFPPGPSMGPVPGFVAMTGKTFPESRAPSVEEFKKQVHESLKFVRGLRDQLATNALTDADKRAVLAKRSEVLKREFAHSDYIPWLIYDEPRRPTTRPAG
jgi:hypothetical protein